MERKLLFEVDLKGAATEGNLAQALSALEALAQDAVEGDQLETWGESVFTDLRVRVALANSERARQPPSRRL
jgi:hypothetical protein